METLLCETAGYLWTQSLHVAVLFAAVAALCWGLRRRSAHVRYLLWLLIVAKCLGPSLVTVSLAILPGRAEPAAAPEAASVPMVFDVPAAPQPVYAAPLVQEVVAAPRGGLLARLAEVQPEAWAAVVWLAVAVLFGAAVALKAVLIHRRIKRLREPAGAAMERELDELAEGRGRPRIWALQGTGQPFVWGMVRGGIYVPADFCGTTDRGRRREILAHELAHVRRYDALVNALQTAAQAVFWFHPFVWVANRAIRAEREKCCDESAIARLAASPREYSSAIVDTLVRDYKSTLPTPSLAIAGPLKNVEDRIKTIMRPGKRFYRRPAFVVVLAVLSLAVVITPTTIALTERGEQADRDAALENASEEVRADVALLRSTDLRERAQAVMRLRYAGMQGKGAAATPYLIDMLGEETPYPAMILMSSSLSSLTQTSSGDCRFGSEAAETLARIGERSDRLLDLLKSDDWRVRADAVRAMGGIKDERAARRLIGFVGDEDEHAEVRGNAALALGLMKETRAARVLVRALKDEDAMVRKSSASALGMIGDASAGAALSALLADSEPEVRMAAVGGLAGLPGNDFVPALLGALGDADRRVREVAGGALARRPDKRALEPLINALRDEYPNARATAAAALGALKDVRAVGPLLEALKDENAYVRWHAATALGAMKDWRAVEPLIAVMMKDEHIARIRAIGALGALGGPRATEALIELLADEDAVIRRNAADALTKVTGQRHGEDQGAWRKWWEANRDTSAVVPAGPDNKPFSVYGRVTDMTGAPAAGVEVRASCGMGTLMPTGRALTDAEGRYVLHFGPGMRMSSKEGHPFNTGFQAATIHAGKDGWYEVNLCRHANLAMSDMEDPSKHPWYTSYQGLVLPNKPYKLDFVMAPAVQIDGRLLDKDGKAIAGQVFWLDGDELYPSSSVFASIKTDVEGRFAVTGVPHKKFWFSIRHDSAELTTGEITFDQPGHYDVELAYEKDNGGAALRLLKVVYVPFAVVPAGMAGTWFFSNAVGDDEQMAIFPDGRVLVLYSNGHRDETRIVDAVIELAEYGGLKARMNYSAADDTIFQQLIGLDSHKIWRRIDAAPKTELLIPLTGDKAQVAIEMRLVKGSAKFAEAAGLAEGANDAGAAAEIALPEGTELNLYSGPVDALKRSDLQTRAWMLDAGQVETLVKATMRDPGSSMLTAPKVMVFANEPAEIRIAEDMGYIKGYEAAAPPGGKPQAIPETLEKGVEIVVTCAPAPHDTGCMTDLVLRHTEVAGSEKRSFGGRSYEMPVIARYELTCKSISIPAGKTLVLCGPRRPIANTTEPDSGGEYMVFMVKPTIVLPEN